MFHLKDRFFRHLNNYKNISFSQCGEDLIVNYIFKLRGITMPTYLDIGCNHPFFLNNTAIFYLKGCKGINIDANPLLIKEFNRSRKEDINVNTGIGNEEDELDFYVISDATLSSFSRTEAEEVIKTGQYKIEKVEKIKLTTVKKILDEYWDGPFPDFLTIDVEGLDLAILETIDLDNNGPKVICVEAAEYSRTGSGDRRIDLIAFLESKGYYEYANTNLNAIMVKRNFWFI